LIMSGIDIDDPLVVEERILDLRFRLRRLEADLELLRETKEADIGFDLKEKVQKKLNNYNNKDFANKIISLEQ
jgi:hypothetical protein